MVKNEIGEIAGIIWNYLDKNGETLYLKLKQDFMTEHKFSEIQFNMALGWLLRENNILVVKNDQIFENSHIKLK
ncbi:MAG: winged helix-turn-helix domain-containing protein [Candidatus Wallbacteria bacterium]